MEIVGLNSYCQHQIMVFVFVSLFVSIIKVNWEAAVSLEWGDSGITLSRPYPSVHVLALTGTHPWRGSFSAKAAAHCCAVYKFIALLSTKLCVYNMLTTLH